MLHIGVDGLHVKPAPGDLANSTTHQINFAMEKIQDHFFEKRLVLQTEAFPFTLWSKTLGVYLYVNKCSPLVNLTLLFQSAALARIKVQLVAQGESLKKQVSMRIHMTARVFGILSKEAQFAALRSGTFDVGYVWHTLPLAIKARDRLYAKMSFIWCLPIDKVKSILEQLPRLREARGAVYSMKNVFSNIRTKLYARLTVTKGEVVISRVQSMPISQVYHFLLSEQKYSAVADWHQYISTTNSLFFGSVIRANVYLYPPLPYDKHWTKCTQCNFDCGGLPLHFQIVDRRGSGPRLSGLLVSCTGIKHVPFKGNIRVRRIKVDHDDPDYEKLLRTCSLKKGIEMVEAQKKAAFSASVSSSSKFTAPPSRQYHFE